MMPGKNRNTPSRLEKKDIIDGAAQYRDRRVSITYRKVKPKQVHGIDPNGKVSLMLKKLLNINTK